MRKLNELVGKLADITMGEPPLQYEGGDLFDYLQKFFSRQDVQELMVQMNQYQLYEENVNRGGYVIGEYSDYTREAKYKRQLPYVNYSFYETGSFYASMGVSAEFDQVEITSSQDGLGEDFMNTADMPATIEMGHIGEMFTTYDPDKSALGLTEEHFEELINDDTLDMRGNIVRKLKEYLNG